MTLPLVTVICICYNHEEFVQQALFSVLNQSYKNIELIVVNNGSSDNSYKKIRQLLNALPSVKLLNFSDTVSNTIAFNKAFKQANGTYLVDLSADDVLLPHAIETQVNFFLKQSDQVALIFGNAYHINEKNVRTEPYFEINEFGKVTDQSLFDTNYKKLLAGGLCMCSVASMFTANHFKTLGGYNEQLFFEDLDYWLRLSKRFKISFLDEIIVEKRFIPKSLGNQFHKNELFSKRITQSVMQIFEDSLHRNTEKDEYTALLKRIHHNMERSVQNKQWLNLIRFTFLEAKCRIYRIYSFFK